MPSAYDWDADKKPRPFRSQSFLATDHDTNFEFAADGTLTILEKDFAPGDDFDFTFVPVARYVPAGRPKLFDHKADTYPTSAAFIAALEELSPYGWRIATGWLVPGSPPSIQAIWIRERP
jgi:hypothetical protein